MLRDHLRFVERALRESGEQGVMLDVGCGGGLFLQMLEERGAGGASHPIAGLDFSTGRGARGMDPRGCAGGMRVADTGSVCRGELRGGHHVSRAGAPLRSGGVFGVRAPAAASRTAA